MSPITLPHTFQDNVGEPASGVQVNENLAVLKAAIEALETTMGTVQGQLPGGGKIRTGAGTLTWLTSTNAESDAIAHGLGKLPSYAAAELIQDESAVLQSNVFANSFIIGVQNMDNGNLHFAAQTVPGVTVTPGSLTKIRWVAVG